MDKLQQEIKDFHEKIKPVLKKILEQYDRNITPKIYITIVKPCKKLIKKCSFMSISDTSCLCSLAYWLYIYECKEHALELCECTHGIDFVYENKNGIQDIYGLEIRIAREILGENRRSMINYPDRCIKIFFSKQVVRELKYPKVLREEEIAACNSRFLTTELLYALYNMVGKGETGLYSELNRNWGEIEQTIIEYIDCLKIE